MSIVKGEKETRIYLYNPSARLTRAQITGVTGMAQGAFLEWLKRRGAYVSPKLDLFGAGVGDDRTVRAAAAVEEGERLLLVPEESTLTLGAGEDATGRCAQHAALSSPGRCVAETLCAERVGGAQPPRPRRLVLRGLYLQQRSCLFIGGMVLLLFY